MIIPTLMQKDGHLRACWLGNDGWLFAQDGHMVATDLDLHLPERSLPPFGEMDALAANLDYLLVTHAHTDHFSPETVRAVLDGGNATLILPESCRKEAEGYGLPEGRIHYVKPGMEIGVPWLRIQTMRALHGHLHGSIYSGASMLDCGYIMTIGGKTIVQPGDTVLLEEHLSLSDIDVLLVSTTEHNMGVMQAERFIEAVQPRHTFAQHFGSYHEAADNLFWTHGYQRELLAALPEDLAARFVIPRYGDVMDIDAM